MSKEGIPSFLLDCHTNDNIAEIEAEYGIKGFAIIVRLWQKIYSEKGYYCEWIERSPLLFSSQWFGGNSGVDKNLIMQVVSKAIKIGIFDESMFNKYAILTSRRIQMQYFDVVKRRTEIRIKNEYLLISVDKIKGIAYIDSISACKNRENVCRNEISKVKESKGKESKGKEKEREEGRGGAGRYFENQELENTFRLFLNYRKNKYEEVLAEETIAAIKDELVLLSDKNDERIAILKRSICRGWKNLYPDDGGKKKTKNKFNDIGKRDYNFKEIESQLLG